MNGIVRQSTEGRIVFMRQKVLIHDEYDTAEYQLVCDDTLHFPSKYPNKRHFKGEKKGKLSGNPNGKNPSDFWEFLEHEWDEAVWEIPNVKSNHPEKTSHPCQYPIELVERCIFAFTNENDIVLAPYAGVASSLITAIMHNRMAVGVDRCQEYIEIGNERIRRLIDGTLKMRPMGRPVYEPTGKEKITQIPLEWTCKEGSVYGSKSSKPILI